MRRAYTGGLWLWSGQDRKPTRGFRGSQGQARRQLSPKASTACEGAEKFFRVTLKTSEVHTTPLYPLYGCSHLSCA